MLKFRDLYDAIRNSEVAYMRMGIDTEAAKCGSPKCVLTREQQELLESYMELANVEVDFCDLNFQTILERIIECFDCVTDDFAHLLPVKPPEPEVGISTCEGEGVLLPLEHIKRFRIYERTYPSPSIPSPVQVYVMTRESLPYSFVPSVPEQVSTNELYTVSWNGQRNSLRIKMTHDKDAGSSPAANSYNICMVVAEIDDQYQPYYGVPEVRACIAYQITPNVRWAANGGLERAIDGDPSTYTVAEGQYKEIICEFAFRV